MIKFVDVLFRRILKMDWFSKEQSRVLKLFEEVGDVPDSDDSDAEPFEVGSDIDPDYIPEESSEDEQEENVEEQRRSVVHDADDVAVEGDIFGERNENDEWKDDTTYITNFDFKGENGGIQIQIGNETTARDIFDLFLTIKIYWI